MPTSPEAGKPDSLAPLELTVVVSVVMALSLQFFSGSALPLLLGAVSEQMGLGGEGVGLLSTFELVSIAVFALGLTPVLASRSRVVVAVLGAVTATAGHGMSALAGDFTELAIARAVAGAGIGMAMASAQAAIAATSQPDRLFAIFFAVSTIVGAVEMAGLPYALEAGGYAWGYSVMAAMSLLAVPLVLWLPRAPVEGSGKTGGLREAPARGLAVCALLAVVLLGACDLGLWSFVERIGSGVGLTVKQIGGVLAAATFSSAVSAVFAAWLGTRLGRIVPLAFTLLAMLCVAIALGYVASGLAYLVLMILWGGTVFLAFTYVMGALAALDPQGRWSAAAAGARTVGGALGPASTGLAVSSFDFPGMGWLVGGWCALALLLALPLARRFHT